MIVSNTEWQFTPYDQYHLFSQTYIFNELKTAREAWLLGGAVLENLELLSYITIHIPQAIENEFPTIGF